MYVAWDHNKLCSLYYQYTESWTDYAKIDGHSLVCTAYTFPSCNDMKKKNNSEMLKLGKRSSFTQAKEMFICHIMYFVRYSYMQVLFLESWSFCSFWHSPQSTVHNPSPILFLLSHPYGFQQKGSILCTEAMLFLPLLPSLSNLHVVDQNCVIWT